MPKTPPRLSQHRRSLRIILGAGILLIIIGLGTAWGLYNLSRSTPHRYAPPQPDDTARTAAERYAALQYQRFYDHLFIDQPFTITLSDAWLNVLLVTAGSDPLVRQWFDIEQFPLAHLQIAFAPDGIHLMGRYDHQQWSGVVTLVLSLSVHQADHLGVSIDSIRAGRLPLPDAVTNTIIRRIAENLTADLIAADAQLARLAPDETAAPSDTAALAAALNDLAAHHHCRWPSAFPAASDTTVRLTGVSTTEGTLELTFASPMRETAP